MEIRSGFAMVYYCFDVGEEIDIGALESLGLLLVRMLAEQIGGELSLEITSGAAFSLRVREDTVRVQGGVPDAD